MTTIPTNTHTDDAGGIPATDPSFSPATNAALEAAVITDGYIDNAATTVAGLDAEIETLQGEKTTLEGEVTALQTDVADAQSQVGSLTTQVGDLTDQVATLDGQKTTLQGEVTSLTDQVTTLESEVGALGTQVTSLTAERDALQAALDELNGSGGGGGTTVPVPVIDWDAETRTINGVDSPPEGGSTDWQWASQDTPGATRNWTAFSLIIPHAVPPADPQYNLTSALARARHVVGSDFSDWVTVGE